VFAEEEIGHYYLKLYTVSCTQPGDRIFRDTLKIMKTSKNQQNLLEEHKLSKYSILNGLLLLDRHSPTKTIKKGFNGN